MKENDSSPGFIAHWSCEISVQRNAGLRFDFYRYSQFFGPPDFERAWRIGIGGALELDRFSLVAHSMGANVAWLFAARTPERLDRLVIEDTAHVPFLEDLPAFNDFFHGHLAGRAR